MSYSFRIQDKAVYNSSSLKLYSKTKLPYASISRIKALFDSFDVNGSGNINVMEVSEFLEEKNLKNDHPSFSNLIDTLKDSSIVLVSFEELIMKMLEIIESNNDNETLENAFDFIDFRRQGFIDILSLRKVLAELGKDYKDETVDEMFRAVDRDGDGKINFSEFIQYFEKTFAKAV